MPTRGGRLEITSSVVRYIPDVSDILSHVVVSNLWRISSRVIRTFNSVRIVCSTASMFCASIVKAQGHFVFADNDTYPAMRTFPMYP